MSRLIDADALLAEILEKPNIRYSNLDLIKTIGDSQTVDAVQVVFCKDCKHYVEEVGACIKSDIIRSDMRIIMPNWFCADGKRR